jgi:hypothetical protein
MSKAPHKVHKLLTTYHIEHTHSVSVWNSRVVARISIKTHTCTQKMLRALEPTVSLFTSLTLTELTRNQSNNFEAVQYLRTSSSSA